MEFCKTKKKLELLNNFEIRYLIKDFCVFFETEITEEEISLIIKKIENKYLTILDKIELQEDRNYHNK